MLCHFHHQSPLSSRTAAFDSITVATPPTIFSMVGFGKVDHTVALTSMFTFTCGCCWSVCLILAMRQRAEALADLFPAPMSSRSIRRSSRTSWNLEIMIIRAHFRQEFRMIRPTKLGSLVPISISELIMHWRKRSPRPFSNCKIPRRQTRSQRNIRRDGLCPKSHCATCRMRFHNDRKLLTKDEASYGPGNSASVLPMSR
jgi:hypothetical protein